MNDRIDDELRKKEELERRRMLEEQRVLEEQQRLQKEQIRTQQQLRQQVGSGSPYQKPKSNISIGKYVVLILILGGLGLLAYNFKDDIGYFFKELGKTIEKIIPDDIGKVWVCLFNPEQCLSGKPGEELTKYKILSLMLGVDGQINPVRVDNYYKLPVTVAKNPNVVNEDTPIENVEIVSYLVCKEYVDDVWEYSELYIEMIPSPKSYPTLYVDEVSQTFETEEMITCDPIETCERVEADLTYEYRGTVKTRFTVGDSKKTAANFEKDVPGPGPVQIRVSMEQTDYYYPGIAWSDDDQLNILFYIKNEGDGEIKVSSHDIEIDDTEGFLTRNGDCDCDYEDDWFDKDEYRECECSYTLNTGEIDNFVENNPSKTIPIGFFVNYKYNKTVRRNVEFKGSCSHSSNGGSNGNNGGNGGNGNGGSEDTSEYCDDYTQSEIEYRLIEIGSNLGINCPDDILDAIAEVESSKSHCYNNQVKVNDESVGEIGIMQISPGSCSGDLYNVSENIDCGAAVLERKYLQYYPEGVGDENDPHSITYDPNGCGYYYTDPCERAVRGYNGWRCPTNDNLGYVCSVYNNLDDSPTDPICPIPT